MLFSSTIFLFAFLPIVLSLYLVLPSMRARNALLLAASLFFYAWGETGYVAILLLSIGMNHGFGVRLDRTRGTSACGRVLVVAVSMNLLLLGVFKYTNFFVDNLNVMLSALGAPEVEIGPVHLPIGISFFTFQAITYVVDIYRRDAESQRDPFQVGLYISLFPQLIAGPIVRYRQVADQLASRVSSADDVAAGIRRFIVGLAKKVLIANTLAVPADRIFAVPAGELQTGVAWFGVLCFSLQIYFDFSGYSDMAIGLGRCFGFRFPENFDWPYLSCSVREFWRRWHMTLSTFFRDYVYVPLGGSRRGPRRTYVNLISVFLLCGLWHGASWTFVVWGGVHGAFMVIERIGWGRVLERLPRLLRQGYTLGVVLVAWVFFRAEDLSHAIAYLGAMTGAEQAFGNAYPLALYAVPNVITVLLIAGLSLLPGVRRMFDGWPDLLRNHRVALESGRLAGAGLLLVACAMSLAAGTHNPFIYFRF